jgi:hypothetical protein
MTADGRNAVEHIDVWSASSDGYSFVTTHESPNGPGFHGQRGCDPFIRLVVARPSMRSRRPDARGHAYPLEESVRQK